MKRLSTRYMHKFGGTRKKNLKRGGGNPRKQTLDFLTQFARVYHAEPALDTNLSSYVLN